MAASVEKMFFESTSLQLGFGLCEHAHAHRVLSEEASLRKQAAIRALVQKPVRDPKRRKQDPDLAAGSTPLLDHEQAERHRWAATLEEIGRRAGPHAKLFQTNENDELTAAETAKLRHLVLTSGAHRTMRAHIIGSWDRFELWAASQSMSVFPVSIEKVLKFR